MQPSPISQTLRTLTAGLTHTHYQLVVVAADFADSHEWARDGSPTAAHWLAAIADVETCTAREWVRVGRALRSLHASADTFANGTPPPTTSPGFSPPGSTTLATPPSSKPTNTASGP